MAVTTTTMMSTRAVAILTLRRAAVFGPGAAIRFGRSWWTRISTHCVTVTVGRASFLRVCSTSAAACSQPARTHSLTFRIQPQPHHRRHLPINQAVVPLGRSALRGQVRRQFQHRRARHGHGDGLHDGTPHSRRGVSQVRGHIFLFRVLDFLTPDGTSTA